MALRLNGIGLTLLGVSAQAADNSATATEWLTVLYLPVLPLRRLQVKFLPHQGSGFAYTILARTPLRWREIARTYLIGWLAVPALLFGPLLLGVRELWLAVGLPEAWEIPYIVLGCLWVAVWVWKLTDWEEARCRPKHKL